MYRLSAIITLFMIVLSACENNSEPFSLNLYPDGQIPNFQDVGELEVWDTTSIVRISKVQIPDIKVYLPDEASATGDAVVICPGGGYHILAYDWEGEDIAEFWNSKGVAAIVLKYRLPSSGSQIIQHKSPLLDAQRAMRYVRYSAQSWGIDPEKIGIMGFSAGGHLASSLSTHYDAGNPESDDELERMSCRPDFSILMYPVISFTGEFQHSGSRKALVGEDSTLMEYFSNEKQVTEDTPPAILIHASDDKGVPVENSIVYYQALIEKGVPAEMHIYPFGGHGFSLALDQDQLSGWPDRCAEWLSALGNEKNSKK
jgi:acetyl esterase/lipase